MKKPQVSTCDCPTFKALNRELYDFAQEVRVAIRAVDACVAVDIDNEDASIVRMWAVTLGPLMHDISGLGLLLLSHGDRRAPVMLTEHDQSNTRSLLAERICYVGYRDTTASPRA